MVLGVVKKIKAEVARVNAELVRPVWCASSLASPERRRQHLLWAFLLRAIQTHLYIHSCTFLCCMKNRSFCRFFFPWLEQDYQQYDARVERIAYRRRHQPDDQWVAPHNLELAAYSPATVNVLLFDVLRGAEQARLYAGKYVGKPEPWYYLETQGGEANPAKQYLKSRNVGLPMCHNRLLGYKVVRCTRPTVFLWPQFVVPSSKRVPRSEDHLENVGVLAYPDPTYYLNEMQKYFYRHPRLRALRAGQFFRYFAHSQSISSVGATHLPLDEAADAENANVPDDPAHRHYYEPASALGPSNSGSHPR